MQNYTIAFLSVVILALAVVISRRWLLRQRKVKNRYGLSLGKFSIGFHFGKWSAYAFPAKASHACPTTGKGYKRTLNQKFLAVR